MKVAICVPCYGGTKSQFTHSLSRMLVWTLKQAPETEIELFFGSLSLLAQLRNWLAEQALNWSADWILWLDADHTFPPDALLRLMVHGQAVVCVNYLQRSPQRTPVAARAGRLIETTADSPPLEPVDACGLGMCLVSAGAVRSLKGAPFAQAMNMSEDVYFLRRLMKEGHQPYVDSRLSLEVGHIWEDVLMLTESS